MIFRFSISFFLFRPGKITGSSARGMGETFSIAINASARVSDLTPLVTIRSKHAG